MKILIAGFTKIKYMPYINFYLENIDKKNNDVHIVYWNRDLKEEDKSFLGENITFHEFKCYQEDDVKKITKIKSFNKYRKYVNSLIENEKFDFIIVLHTLPGVLICDTLFNKYKNNYILDYRDFTYEFFAPFRSIIHKLVKRSALTYVSSDAYRKYLPTTETEKILTSHNLLMDAVNHKFNIKKSKKKLQKVRIAFWGFIRDENLNMEIINKVSKDKRFELHYYGREQRIALNLKNYVSDNKIKNVYFHGEYTPVQRYEFAKSTDVIHNVYNNQNSMMSMGNKYYDGIIFRIPQLCMENSYMGKRVEQCGVGIMTDPFDNNFLDKVYDYILNLNTKDFVNNCEQELDRIIEDIEISNKMLKDLLNK